MILLNPIAASVHPAATDNPSVLTFTVIAALVTVSGSLVALLVKDFLLVRYFEKYKEKASLKKISKRYKDPILLSAKEVLSRVESILKLYKYDSKNFTRETLFDKSECMVRNHPADPYYLRNRLTSTLYRFCSFWGWLELYRQDLTFLDSYSYTQNLQSSAFLDDLRSAIADGQLNNGPKWRELKDSLIFREELRSIGEGMIETVNNQRTIIGYGKFQGLLGDFETNAKNLWLRPAINFFTYYLPEEEDFRHHRLELIKSALHNYIKTLDEEFYEAFVVKKKQRSGPVVNSPLP
ncbi:MAG TPA: hypothetical protein VNX40_08525 [Mucilaginibacter sp.]|jgi:hypothetical protein|nr:hypothetical protein [Mucilaginibacter sp.]